MFTLYDVHVYTNFQMYIYIYQLHNMHVYTLSIHNWQHLNYATHPFMHVHAIILFTQTRVHHYAYNYTERNKYECFLCVSCYG